MIVVNQDIQNILSSGDVKYILFITLSFPDSAGGELRMVDASYPIDNFLASRIYLASDPPGNQSGFNRSQYSIRLQDNDGAIVTRLNQRYTNVPVLSQIKFVNPDSTLTDFLTIFRGYISSARRDVSGGAVSVTVNCVSEFTKNDASRGFYTTKDSLSRYSQTDTSFDFVVREDNDSVRNWGRI